MSEQNKERLAEKVKLTREQLKEIGLSTLQAYSEPPAEDLEVLEMIDVSPNCEVSEI